MRAGDFLQNKKVFSLNLSFRSFTFLFLGYTSHLYTAKSFSVALVPVVAVVFEVVVVRVSEKIGVVCVLFVVSLLVVEVVVVIFLVRDS